MSLIQRCLSPVGSKKTILVFDGGGVRGRFALELCCTIAREQPVPLSQLFSMVVGVSAGAMIATLVACGILDDVKQNPDACSAFYKMLPQMFGKPHPAGPLLMPKYNGKGKREALHKILGDKRLKDVKTPLVILCCTLDGEPIEFRSWDPAHGDLLLADLNDASSAAPGFFPPVELREDAWFTDGGVRANKPLISALLATIDLFDQDACNIHMLSIGTFFAPTQSFLRPQAQLMGLLMWLKERRLIDALLGMQDRTSERLMNKMFGKRFLRLECQCDDIRMDDHSEQRQLRLRNAAAMVWQQRKQEILEFVVPAASSSSSSTIITDVK